MAKSGNFKWCVLFVACIALYVYQRSQSGQQNQQSPFGVSSQLQGSGSESAEFDDGVYTATVPARDFNSVNEINSVVDQNIDDDFLDGELNDNFEELNSAPELAPAMPEEQGFSSVEPDSFQGDLEDELFEFESQDSVPTEVEQLPVRRKSEVTAANPAMDLPEGVNMKAVQQIEYGKSLARRGAAFGAKNSFHNAMRLIAQAVDYQTGTQDYTDSLYRATVALKEADDFFFAQGENGGRVDVPSIARNHESMILSPAQMQSMTPVQAMQEYYNYIQKNYAVAGGNSIVASEAMFCLGKLYVVKGKDIIEGSPLDNAKAIVHHRAALECNDGNYKSANELAVLLAKTGRLDQAKNLLLHSLKIKQVPQAWENLAFVHDQLGERDLAQLAITEFQRMMNAPPTTQQINWVAPQQFANGGVEPAALRTAMNPQPVLASPRPPKQSTVSYTHLTLPTKA